MSFRFDPSHRKAPFASLEEQMASIPFRNEKAEEVSSDKTHLVVAVEQKYAPWVKPFCRFLGLKQKRKYSLDGLSLQLFRQLDGISTVGDLVERLMREHALTFFEARGLTIHYLQILMENGLAVIVVPEAVAGDPASSDPA